jgi:hypothetical protein
MEVRSGADRADRTVEEVTEPPADNHAPDPGTPVSANGHAKPDSDNAVPEQRGSQPEKVAADTE